MPFEPAAALTPTPGADPPSMWGPSAASSPAPSDRAEFRNLPAMIPGTHNSGFIRVDCV